MNTIKKENEKRKNFSEHLLIAILIAIGVALAGAVFVLAAFKDLYAEYVALFVFGSLFFGSIIFYFFYIFFRSIQKLTWLFGGIAVFGFMIVIANCDLDIYLRNLFNNTSLPKEYNEYQDLKDQTVLQFKNKEMRSLFDGCDDPLKQYMTVRNNLIVEASDCMLVNSERILGKIYYKFDSLGNIIAKYKPSESEEVIFEGYLINVDENYYRTWALDGDTLKRKIETYNENFSLDTIKQTDFVKNISKKANFLFSTDCYKTTNTSLKKFRKIIFWEKNKWNAFYDDRKIHQIIESKGTVSNHFFANDPAEANILRTHYIENIQYEYFQKTKLGRYDSGGEFWDGFLYTNIVIGNDTLKIKKAFFINNNGTNENIKINGKAVRDSLFKILKNVPYYYYSNPKIQYQLFTDEPYKLYIIKNSVKTNTMI
ncbi:hypothetical protein DBB36_21880 [Flavobacterium sp. WLB]|uniref:hypothetical protein n=1 Tax=unclassified Flavobacterium TaxID=196869 RepID=UPI0006AB79AD|nr:MULTISPECIES: hypothetical protein [unclassified Flavobacterium]KOP39808.1 hypothetical protein AKO67_02685 [Flavobacterium sp. VMW]OWU92596.1 hypothetical protein APR43_00605 [Flavobacterium sp. NLM]PUU67848.1 hypothetical protein DBB36_21880 [Flavobacterium sp. WLB]